jgi:hypothetical protein
MDKSWHLIMIPVRQSKNQLLVIQIRIWIFRVVNDERASKAIWILPIYMRVVPVRAGLCDLFELAMSSIPE